METMHEQIIREMGDLELATLMQVLRLQNPYPSESPEYLLWNEQCQINIPFLIHASFYLDAYCQKRDKKRILFTARDCCLWIQLFKTLYPNYDSIYFHASRWLYDKPSSSFTEYVRNLYVDNTVIVDLHGTGSHCIRFFNKNLKKFPNYLIAINVGKNKCHGILRKEGRDYFHAEMLNYDVVGALYDMQDAQPLRAPLEYNIRYVHPSHACLQNCIELLPSFQVRKFRRRIMEWATRMFDENLQVSRQIRRHAYRHRHYPIPNTKGEWKHFYLTQIGGIFEVGVKMPWEWEV